MVTLRSSRHNQKLFHSFSSIEYILRSIIIDDCFCLVAQAWYKSLPQAPGEVVATCKTRNFCERSAERQGQGYDQNVEVGTDSD